MVITLLANILRKLVPENQFIGHVGGDDFVIIFNSLKTQDTLDKIVRSFEAEVLALYSRTDLQNNYITAKSRYGRMERFPLMTLTAVSVNNESHAYTSTYEISEELAALKNRAKQHKAG